MNTPLIDTFKATYADTLRIDLGKLDQLYSADVVFRDPLHTLRGLPALQDYFAHITGNVNECRFEFLDQLCGPTSAYFKWHMHFRHPKLAGGDLLTLRGMSHIQFSQEQPLIHFHEDCYDMGQMLYEHLPGLGFVVCKLKQRLVN